MRLIQSRRNLRQSIDCTRSALRTAIVRPSSLVLVAVASGISAFLVGRLLWPSVKRTANSANSTVRAGSLGLVRTLVSLFGARLLSVALQLGAVVWKRSGSRADANTAGTPVTGDAAISEHASHGPGRRSE
jgi:hypothetical protein